MSDEDLNEFDSAVRMSIFAAANDALIKTNAKAVSGFAALDADIAEMEAAGATSSSADGLRSDGTADKTAAKSALIAYVRKIAKTAKIIKVAEPDFDNQFQFVRGNIGGEDLLTAARAFAGDLPPVAAKFEEYALKGDPVGKLNGFIANFTNARAQQNTGKGSGIAATAQTGATVKRLKQNRAMLKVVVTNLLEDAGDAGKLAEWKAACKVERAAKKPKDKTPPKS